MGKRPLNPQRMTREAGRARRILKSRGVAIRTGASYAEIAGEIVKLHPEFLPLGKHKVIVAFTERYGTEVASKSSERATIASFVSQFGVRRLKAKDAPQSKKRSYPDQTGFYWSDAWRALRYEVLKEHGGRCMLCGRTAKDGIVIHVDHIKPRSKYPELELDKSNLQVFCEDCNLGKMNRDEIDWRPIAAEQRCAAPEPQKPIRFLRKKQPKPEQTHQPFDWWNGPGTKVMQ